MENPFETQEQNLEPDPFGEPQPGWGAHRARFNWLSSLVSGLGLLMAFLVASQLRWLVFGIGLTFLNPIVTVAITVLRVIGVWKVTAELPPRDASHAPEFYDLARNAARGLTVLSIPFLLLTSLAIAGFNGLPRPGYAGMIVGNASFVALAVTLSCVGSILGDEKSKIGFIVVAVLDVGFTALTFVGPPSIFRWVSYGVTAAWLFFMFQLRMSSVAAQERPSTP